ncbi:alpha/beta hydrolase [Tianweitania sp. BSSL-BM11]|uniref:Alpha/beta hydrolase n=1 Tax=Tianweitania aestuarii TaxID=2814886 RepID=A0ABS5RWH3_9HYPH|nr:alpha/beta hydrolase [Tianweitania aestuarii]MBS9721342.1 alpha/beta hydrolase [Tianweitania aestuarii]
MSELLFETEANPIPEGATAGMLTMRDGKRIRYALFRTEVRPIRGTVVTLTGRNECIEKYFETVRDLQARGFEVVTLDWRGQGNSDRSHRDRGRGHIRSFHQYVEDLDQLFIDVVLPDCRAPFYMLAHSAGALIALLAAPRMTNRIRRMVLSGPLITLTGYTTDMPSVSRVSNLLYWLGLGGMYLGSGPRPREAAPFETNKVTSDLHRYRRNQAIYAAHPELALGGPTAAWVRAMTRAAAEIQDQAFVSRMHIPTLFVAAGNDTIVSTRAIELYTRRLRSGSLLTIDGAKHELLQERDTFRDQFMAAFDAFVPGTD